MSAELHADDEAARPQPAPEAGPATDALDRSRPNLSGDLSTAFQAAPMFRRAIAGYDRFQVDTYVQWAEEELTTADREREHLVARHLRTRAALEEARRLLSHSQEGGEFLRMSRRAGAMLAAAADEAESIRAEAESDRTTATTQAQRMIAEAERSIVDAETEADRMVAEAATEVQEMTAAAARIVEEAERTGRVARAEAEAHLEKVRAIELRTAEHLRRCREQAVEEAAAARLHARDEIVRMLITGREERRRADAVAATTRERLDRDAAARRDALLIEIADLERRVAALRVDPTRAAQPDTRPSGALRLYVRGHLERTLEHLRSHVVFHRSAPSTAAHVDRSDGRSPETAPRRWRRP